MAQSDLIATTEGNIGMSSMKKMGNVHSMGYGFHLPKPKMPSMRLKEPRKMPSRLGFRKY